MGIHLPTGSLPKCSRCQGHSDGPTGAARAGLTGGTLWRRSRAARLDNTSQTPPDGRLPPWRPHRGFRMGRLRPHHRLPHGHLLRVPCRVSAPTACRWRRYSRIATATYSSWTQRRSPEVSEEPLPVPADRGPVHCRLGAGSDAGRRRPWTGLDAQEARSHIRYSDRRTLSICSCDTFGHRSYERSYRVALPRDDRAPGQHSHGREGHELAEFAGLFCARGGGMTGAAGSPGVSHDYLDGQLTPPTARPEYPKTAELGEARLLPHRRRTRAS